MNEESELIQFHSLYCDCVACTEQREKEKAERDDRTRRNQFSAADIS